MSADLPERPSLEFLKKLAKERLQALRAKRPSAKLAEAQLDVARELNFPSWRALKAALEQQRAPELDAFFEACRTGDVAALRALLAKNPRLVHARDIGDNATGLHGAAANGHLEAVRLLLDAGADVHGHGDVHEGDVIGWAAGEPVKNRAVIELLLERGAKHHIFSAIAMNDPELVRRIVQGDRHALTRRLSKFEQHQSPLHFALFAPNAWGPRPPQYDIARLLISLGADLEAEDDLGRTPLAVAMLLGDVDATRLLQEAGAKPPKAAAPRPGAFAQLKDSMFKQITPMLCVEDVDRAVRWYEAMGFTVHERYPNFAYLSMGEAVIMIQDLVKRPRPQVALWFHTNKIEELYGLMKARQLEAMSAGKPEDGIRFHEDLYDPPYGGRQFSVEDSNGFEVVFYTR